MTENSLAHEAARTSPLERHAEVLEEELARLRAKRPALAERLERATHILVVHLACPDERQIRVRTRNGRARLLVKGSAEAVYVVDPSDWSCSCPDFHRANLGACKHGLAAYLLWRAGLPQRNLRKCDGCDGRFYRRGLVEVQGENEHHFPGDLLCRGCARRAGVTH